MSGRKRKPQSKKKKATRNKGKRRSALRPLTIGKIPTAGRKQRRAR